MTTVYKQKLLMMSFQGRSPRQIYSDSCNEHNVRVQKSLRDDLSNSTDDFGKLQHLLCSGLSLGVRGCLAIVPILQCSRNLRRVDLKGCGVTDELVGHLVQELQEHPTIRTIDLSDNPFITVHSGKGLVKMAELNPNIVACDLTNTHVGTNVAKVVTTRCEANRMRIVSYFADEYFRMKDLFNAVDADGSGWVHIKNIVGSVNAPILQERLIERIALKRPKKRSDNCIHVNTFMELVYLNYKTAAEIQERAKDTTDSTALTIKTNWKLLITSMRAINVQCVNLSKFRIREMVLSHAEADELVAQAVELAMSSGRIQPSSAASNEPHAPTFVPDINSEELEGGGAEAPQGSTSQTPPATTGAQEPATIIDARDFIMAYRTLFPSLPSGPKQYGFLKERSEDYVSPLLRNGSRCVSITDMSSNATPALSQLGDDDDDPVHSWKLPPSMVKAIVALFNGTNGEQPIDLVLDTTPSTELEHLRVAALCSRFAQYSIPTDVSMLTLQETVNMLDEHYDLIRVDRNFTVAEIEKMVGL